MYLGLDAAREQKIDALEKRLQHMTNLLENHITANAQPTVLPQAPAPQPDFASFVVQLKMFKEAMTLMQPPTPHPPPTAPPTPPPTPPPAGTSPSGSTPLFTLDTIERLAGMFK